MIPYRGSGSGCYGGGGGVSGIFTGSAAFCRCEIQLENDNREIFTNFDRIRGRVNLFRDGDKDFYFHDLRIRLEGYVASKFAISHFDRRTLTYNERRFLPDESTEESFAATIISFYFIRNGKPKKPEFRIEAHRNVHSFPFELALRGQTIPASFESDLGRVRYELVVYGYLNSIEARKTLTTKGCFNLTTEDPSHSRPLVANWTPVGSRETTRSSSSSSCSSSLLFSFGSKKPNIVQPTLFLNQRGFLPGDHLIFQLDVVNSNFDHLLLLLQEQEQQERCGTKLTAMLVQKIIYYANKLEKITTTILDRQEIIFDPENLQSSVHWEGAFVIPRGLMPTFNQRRKQPVKIRYYLQITIMLDGKLGVRGEAPIIIGTTRGEGSGPNRPDEGVEATAPPGPLRRTSEIEQLPPPSYYDLPPTRRCSLESLPPTYQEVLDNINRDDGSNLSQGPTCCRPRSNSSVM